jgi:hypothetical protein
MCRGLLKRRARRGYGRSRTVLQLIYIYVCTYTYKRGVDIDFPVQVQLSESQEAIHHPTTTGAVSCVREYLLLLPLLLLVRPGGAKTVRASPPTSHKKKNWGKNLYVICRRRRRPSKLPSRPSPGNVHTNINNNNNNIYQTAHILTYMPKEGEKEVQSIELALTPFSYHHPLTEAANFLFWGRRKSREKIWILFFCLLLHCCWVCWQIQIRIWHLFSYICLFF